MTSQPSDRPLDDVARFFDACANGDVEGLRPLLAANPRLAHVANPRAEHGGMTGLHAAALRGHTAIVRLLLEHGADPNARETGDNTYPLHWAAAGGHLETARALLDAGGDVHGYGDLHELGVIGWASFLRLPGMERGGHDAVISLLLERGARHDIISAIAVGDLNLVRRVVDQTPGAVAHRMSRFEHGQTPLHLAVNRRRVDILDLLIERGAELDAVDGRGQTALAAAMLSGNRDAMTRLGAAGAKAPEVIAPLGFREGMATQAGSVKKGVPMIGVANVARSLDWYVSMGFRELARYADGGTNFGMVSFGQAELMLVPQKESPKGSERPVSLWFYTDRVDDLYQLLKSRQLAAAQSALAGLPPGLDGVDFDEDINEPFYGGRQFGIRDPDGYVLYFLQSAIPT